MKNKEKMKKLKMKFNKLKIYCYKRNKKLKI